MIKQPAFNVTQNPNGSTTIEGNCVITGKPHSVTVVTSQLVKWQQGALIQDAFPNLHTEDREFLQSGISPEGWKKAFSKKKK